MKLVKVTPRYEAQVDDDLFAFINQYKWSAHSTKKRADGTCVTYARHRSKEHGTFFMHHKVLGVTVKELRKIKRVVDHDNGDGLCNIKANLDITTHKNNSRNTKYKLGRPLGKRNRKNRAKDFS